MPELMDGALIFGFLAAILSWMTGRHSDTKRRVPIWGTILIAVAAAYVGPPAFAWVQQMWREVPFLPDVTGGMVFIGLFAALTAHILFERKGHPRRIPIWAKVVIAVIAGLGIPLFMDKVTGSYQNASIRPDVNHCTRGMQGEVQPRHVTNICNFSITVGLCLPDELNPAPCIQSATLAPGESTRFDPGDARRSYAPGNRNGLTVVACRPPHRPSRRRDIAKRSHDGVCLPGH